ncbi:hypothetical protein Mapa_000470 [Marchantia paleacea]|nr:hypothetical protein Mapa_000470 [Marchantia paleacea]
MGSLPMTLQWSTVIYIILTVSGLVAAAPEADLVTNLPGLPALGFKIYSGYVTVDEGHGRALFYFFVEAQNDPQSKPLTLWLNGGPGCSSFGFGNFVEHGPFSIRDNAVVLNPFSWNRVSNVLYLESPAGVGFSYSNTSSDYTTDDEKTAQDAFTFMQGWVQKFPEYQNRTFFIAGESYGGYYVPQLAALLVKQNFSSPPFLQLRGIMIGNPSINLEADAGADSVTSFLWSHGLISDDSYAKLRSDCHDFKPSYMDIEACASFLDYVYRNETALMDWYDILSDTCPAAYLNAAQPKNLKMQMMPASRSKGQKASTYPCHTLDMVPYLARQDVQAVLHVRNASIPAPWSQCSEVLSYNITTETVEPLLKLLIESDMRLWVYSGDQDSAIPFSATRRRVEKLSHETGLRITSHYQPWYTDNQIGGWTVSYGPNLLFATVRGAGHFVPTDQPVRALRLFSSFLSDLGLPLGRQQSD